jgi:hypothetical protein
VNIASADWALATIGDAGDDAQREVKDFLHRGDSTLSESCLINF